MRETQKISIQPGIYKNKKNGHLYFFTGEISTHSETLDLMIEYYTLYGDIQKWTRPLSIFLEEKELGNPKSTRFELIYNLSSRTKNMILPGSRICEQKDDSIKLIYTVFSISETGGNISIEIRYRMLESFIIPISAYFLLYKSAE